MYSLRLTCRTDEIDRLSAELWERGTSGIREVESDGQVGLIAGFEGASAQRDLLLAFRDFSPEWHEEIPTDWVRQTEEAWPAQSIGARIFMAPPWNRDPTPAGRTRIIHNPGLACGTGRHPCSQLALMAIEQYLMPGNNLADIGTGSGILAIAALKVGAAAAIGVDLDESALAPAKENFLLNSLEARLVCGSANCVGSRWANVTVANISVTVLIAIADELMRITRKDGWLILTGFDASELHALQNWFPRCRVTGIGEWRCISVKLS